MPARKGQAAGGMVGSKDPYAGLVARKEPGMGVSFVSCERLCKRHGREKMGKKDGPLIQYKMIEEMRSVGEAELLRNRMYRLTKEKKKVLNTERCTHLTRICVVFTKT